MSRRRVDLGTIELVNVVAFAEDLAAHDAHWRAQGFAQSSARLWRCRDGSTTVRVVWRRRDAPAATATYTGRGLRLP